MAPVDPRTSRWESDEPAYRVYFWQRLGERPDAGWSSDEWRLTEADVADVLAWAAGNAAGRRVTVWVEVMCADEPGLVRLSGWEPTSAADPPAWVVAAG